MAHAICSTILQRNTESRGRVFGVINAKLRDLYPVSMPSLLKDSDLSLHSYDDVKAD